MKSILSLVCVAFFATFAYAGEGKLEDTVDMWSMGCKEDSCLMTIEKATRESSPNHDFFVLGIRVVKVGGKPASFVFLPASNPEQTRVAFIFYDIQKNEPRLVTRASTAFLTQPCSTPNECKRVFDGAVVPQLPGKGEGSELNLWEAMNTHAMLLILQFSPQREVHRSALISLFPFRKAAGELWQSYQQSANPAVQGTLRDKAAQRP
jgi:hypothetical protein